MEAKKFKRKKRFIKNSSQPVLILRIYLILIFVMLASGAVFYFMGNQSLTKELFQAHSIIKNTMQLLLPGLILVNAIGLLGASLLVVVFTHSIAGPIYRLKMLSVRIASGDLSVEVKFRSKDTIQELSDIMNTILRGLSFRLKGFSSSVEKLKELSQKINNLNNLSQDELSSLKKSLLFFSSIPLANGYPLPLKRFQPQLAGRARLP